MMWTIRASGMALLLAMAGIAKAAPDVRAGIAAWSTGDTAKAVAIWRTLAAAGDADAQFNLAQAYKLGRGVPLDLASAQKYYDRAARQGHHEAQTSLGLALFGNGDRVGAMRWLRLAAEGGEPRALLLYGTALFNGDGMTSDPVRAYAMISRAAAQGLPPALATLKDMDSSMSLADRQRGTALALTMAARRSSSVAIIVPTAPARLRPKAEPRPKVASAAPARTLAKEVRTPAKAAPTMPAPATGAWRIQLGAFSQRSAAESLYRRLSAGGALAGRHPIFTSVGAVTRLQVAPFPDRAAAAAACAALKSQACFPVR
jgi:uncharacterized protein